MLYAKVRRLDHFLLIFHLLIFTLGAFAILSADFSSFESQLIFLVVGLALYFLVAFNDYGFYRSYSWYIYVLGVLSLLGVFAVGISIRGSVRWYDLKVFNFQPSELAKLFEILVLAALFSPLSGRYLTSKRIVLSFFLMMIYAFLIVRQPDLGNGFIVLGIWVIMSLYAGIRFKYIVFLTLSVFLLSFPAWSALHSYQRQRIISFINPYSDPLSSGYNVIQSVVAVGSGGILGRGFGRGTQSHLNFLPEHKTDFIFASFSEEWGLLGALILLGLYCAMLVRILKISKGSSSDFGSLICVGVFSLLFVQLLVNIGMNIGIVPVTGITLPLVSYGGSSLIITNLCLGLVQSVAIKSRL